MRTLEGLRRVQTRGVVVPAAVLAATAEYKTEQDPLGAFLSDCCEVEPRLSISRAAMWTLWETWAIDNGEEQKSARFLKEQLTRRGFQEYKRGGIRGFTGIAEKKSLPEEVPYLPQVPQVENGGAGGALRADIPKDFSFQQNSKKREKGNHADSEPGYNTARDQ